MITRIIAVATMLILSHTSLVACDACGGGSSNLGNGLLTDFRSNFIRLSYFETRYHYYAAGNKVKDKFIQANLSVRCALGKSKRVRLMAHLPYGMNTRDDQTTQLREKGLADIRLQANYALINGISLGQNSTFYLEAGGGVSLPTGSFDDQIHEKNLPENFNIGRGAVGYIFQANMVYNLGKSGLVFSNNYQMNNQTNSGYHFGSQFNNQLTAFSEIDVFGVSLIPNVGMGYEQVADDQYANSTEVPGTGGTGFFFSTALNFKTEKWLAGISTAIPISENYSDGEVTASNRLAVHISYIF